MLALALLVCITVGVASSMVYKRFDKKSAATHTETEINSNSDSENQQLAGGLHNPIIRKFEKCKVYSSSKGKTWCANVADM